MDLRNIRIFVKIVRSSHCRIGIQLKHLVILLNDADHETDACVERIIN